MKKIDWSEMFGVGEIVCTCDNCSEYESFEFDDNSPNFRKCQNQLRDKGWCSLQINGKWRDFCCEKCRNDYIKSH